MAEEILIVDDDIEICKLIQIYLENEGYICRTAYDGKQAQKMAKNHPIELMILDVMIPFIDGIEVCKKLRETMDIPILFLSAKSEDLDKISGLTAGGDDYITKPFNPLELVARVKSHLRRFKVLNQSGECETSGEIFIGDLYMNVETHEIKIADKAVHLTPIEFDILHLLASNQNVVFSADRIYETIWEEEPFESKNTVMVHIRKIREKIELDTHNPQYIKTVWGVGYKI